MITHFQLLLWSLYAFLKMAIWFQFSENGSIILLNRGESKSAAWSNIEFLVITRASG